MMKTRAIQITDLQPGFFLADNVDKLEVTHVETVGDRVKVMVLDHATLTESCLSFSRTSPIYIQA